MPLRGTRPAKAGAYDSCDPAGMFRRTRRALAMALLLVLLGCGSKSPPPLAQFLKDKQAAVFVFLATDCPLSQSYTSTLKNLRSQFQSNQIEVYGVFVSDTGVEDFAKTYNLTF